MRTTLDRLGDPEEIVAEELERLELPDRHAGGVEILTVVLLFAGGFLFLVGWFVGAVLLWSSRAWTVREKLIGTWLLPGGFAASLWLVVAVGLTSATECGGLGRRRACVGGASTAHEILVLILLAVLVLTPIATAVFLLRRARSRPRQALALH